jgi:hypothetical protein
MLLPYAAGGMPSFELERASAKAGSCTTIQPFVVTPFNGENE